MEAQHRLRILHVSDLHVVDPAKDPHRQRRELVLGPAWDENLDKIAADGPIDLVCFTGDLAYSGNKAEYARLTGFVDAMLARVGVPRSRFFVVPGNHDVDRNVAPDALIALRELDEEEKLSTWMLGGRAPRGVDAEHRDAVLARQGAYREWVRSTLQRPELVPGPGGAHPTLGYRQTIRVRDLPFDIHIIGLDSAWLAHDDSDARKLRLTRDQVLRLSAGPDGEVLGGFRLALIHHPLTDLADGESSRRLLAEQVDLLLRGHLHEAEMSFWADADRGMRELTAGTLHGGDLWPNGCQVVDIALDRNGKPTGYDLWFRGWSSRGRGFWVDKNGLYKGSKDGRLSWPKRVEVAAPIQRPQEVFVGREKELAELEAALIPASGAALPVAIGALQGMPGVGKSYLADRFAALHTSEFPGGYVKLALNADESRSVDDLGSALATQLDVSWRGESTWAGLRARLLRPRALLHIENADAETSERVTVELVQRLGGCAVIVSGCFQGLGAGEWAQIAISTLDEDKAVELLQKEAGPDIPLALQDTKSLARELGYLPLALHLAGGHLRAGVTVDAFLRKLNDRTNLLGLEPRPRVLEKGVLEKGVLEKGVLEKGVLEKGVLEKGDERGILRSTFALSLDLLKKDCGESDDAWTKSFATLGHIPAGGVGKSLGAAMAGLSEDDFEDLMNRAVRLSLATHVAGARQAWSLHPQIALLLRQSIENEPQWMDRMTAWFLARLPRLPYAQHQEQGKLWKEIGQEGDALVSWLGQMPLDDAMSVARRSQRYAIRNGPYSVWISFCDRVLANTDDFGVKSAALWTLCNVARRAGLHDRALTAAQDKSQLEKTRGNDHESALAAGAIATILQARGNLNEALRIRREVQLPVHDRLGDVHARAVTMGKIADILQARGDLDEALRIRREEQLPVYKRLGDVRSLLVGRTNLAIDLLSRNTTEDRIEASDLLRLALRDAEAMGIPETATIRKIQSRHNLT